MHEKAIELIAGYVRTWKAKHDYRVMQKAIVKTQSKIRGWNARKRFLQWRIHCRRPLLIRVRRGYSLLGNEHPWASVGPGADLANEAGLKGPGEVTARDADEDFFSIVLPDKRKWLFQVPTKKDLERWTYAITAQHDA